MSRLTVAAEVAGLILLALAVVLANLRRTAARQARKRRARTRPALRLVRGTAPAAPRAARSGTAMRRPAARPALSLVADRAPAAAPASVEDRVPGPAALELEEPVGAGHQQHAVPQPRGVLTARDR
jgi:hypothetical protein